MAKIIIFFLVLIGSFPIAEAHNPGLSRSSVRMDNDSMVFRMEMATEDLEAITSFRNRNADIPTEYLSNGVIVRLNDTHLEPISIRALEMQRDAVGVELRYLVDTSSIATISIPLLSKLPRGHRQHLSVHATKSTPESHHLLSAGSETVELYAKRSSNLSVFSEYVVQGIWHIWIGIDHIAFLLTLLLPVVLIYREHRWSACADVHSAVWNTIKLVTAFTVAHSMTLALSVLEIVVLPGRYVEVAIALSVLIAGVNNLRPFFPASRTPLAFSFGLLHGFGFANVLTELGLADNAWALALLGFNVGVEVGQLAIVLLTFPVIATLRGTRFYQTWVFPGGSVAAVVTACIWTVDRAF